MRVTAGFPFWEGSTWEWELGEAARAETGTGVLFRHYGFGEGYAEIDFAHTAQTWALILARLAGYLPPAPRRRSSPRPPDSGPLPPPGPEAATAVEARPAVLARAPGRGRRIHPRSRARRARGPGHAGMSRRMRL